MLADSLFKQSRLFLFQNSLLSISFNSLLLNFAKSQTKLCTTVAGKSQGLSTPKINIL